MDELKKYLKERIKETEECLNSFDPNDGYDYEIGSCEGELGTLQEILRWIITKEEQ